MLSAQNQMHKVLQYAIWVLYFLYDIFPLFYTVQIHILCVFFASFTTLGKSQISLHINKIQLEAEIR